MQRNTYLHRDRLHSQPIRRIDVPVRDVKWSDSGQLVAILSDQSFYVLRFARDGALHCFGHHRRCQTTGIVPGLPCNIVCIDATQEVVVCTFLSVIMAYDLIVINHNAQKTLGFNKLPCQAVVDAHLESGADIDEDGIDDAFELLNEVSEHVRTGVRSSSIRCLEIRQASSEVKASGAKPLMLTVVACILMAI